MLNKGDIILFVGNRNPFEKMIGFFTGGKYSHAAMYVANWYGNDMILESSTGGVQITTFNKYRGREYCVLRSDLPGSRLKDILSESSKDIGKKYDYKGLIGYAISDIIFSITKKRKQYHGSKSLFCSELIKHHYEHAGKLDLTEKPSSNSSPMDLFRSKYLKVIHNAKA